MRSSRSLRLAPLALAAALLVTACGDSLETDTTTDTSDTSAASAASDDATETGASGASDAAESGTTVADDGSSDAGGSNGKPEVEIPDTLPTELVITDLVDGTGDAAVVGDTVVVNYVGVRSADGTEFDNSYDRGAPFSVPLGSNTVIAGWEEGLIGAKQGGRRQLDIPADLAYGDSPQGDIIQPGDALTFVVDVVAIIAKSDPADAPEVDIEPGQAIDSVEIEELTAGSGDEVEPGQTVAFNYLFFRADTGEQLESSWDLGAPQTLPFDEAAIPPILFEAFDGVSTGTVRKVSIPFADASEIFQLTEESDIVLVLEIITIF